MFGLDEIIGAGLKIIDKVIPDPQAKAEAQQKLLELQQTGAIKFEEFDIKREEISLFDKQDARDLQKTALTQEDKFAKHFLYYLTIFWSVSSVAYIGFITFAHIPPENTRFADTILGFVLGTVMAGMFSYFYGSSSSSKAKDATIQKMQMKN